MIKTHYRWVIVAAGGLLGCVAIGAMFSLPVFIRPISRDTGWSITGISSAMTFGFLALALGSIVWGSLSDRFGPRAIVMIGSVGLAASLFLASRAASLGEFQLMFGLLVGGAIAVIRHARTRATPEGEWVRAMLARKPTKVVALALANKTARIAWAIMKRGEAYVPREKIVGRAA